MKTKIFASTQDFLFLGSAMDVFDSVYNLEQPQPTAAKIVNQGLLALPANIQQIAQIMSHSRRVLHLLIIQQYESTKILEFEDKAYVRASSLEEEQRDGKRCFLLIFVEAFLNV